MKRKLKVNRFAFAGAVALLEAQVALAAPASPTGAAVASVAQATDLSIGRETLPVLVVLDRPGRPTDWGLDLLQQKGFLANSEASSAKRTLSSGHATFLAPSFVLETSDSGRKLRFRRTQLGSECTSDIAEFKNRLAAQAGAHFETIRGLLEMTSDESIVTLSARYKRLISGTPNGYMSPEQVCEGTLVYGRSVNGVPVVGPGSKVSVTVNAAGSMVGLKFDWPSVGASGKTQAIVAPDGVRSRALQVQSNAFGASADRLSSQCGYFDPGESKRRRGHKIQASCLLSYGSVENPKSRTIEVLPIGDPIVRDATFRAVTSLCAKGLACSD